MIFSVEVDNKHLQRLGKRLGYTGDPQDAAAFKAFVQAITVAYYKKLIKSEVRLEEEAKINVDAIVLDTEIKQGA